jgi:putative ABC transport system permease protein
VRVLLALAPAHTIPRLEQIHVDWWVLAFTFGLSVLTGIGFGLAPALHATGRELRASLGQGARTVTPRHERLRGMLVVSEFALALVLLTGAGLLLQTYVRMRAVNPGFRPENVMTMTVDLPGAVYHTAAEMRQFHSATLARLSSVPGVIAAGSVNWKPLGGNLIRGTFQVEGKRLDGPGFMVDKPAVSPGYFPTMGMPLLRGRDFTVRDGPSAPGVVIVSRSVARLLWGDDDPIGRRVSLADHPKPEDWFTIVGVVDDVMQQGLRMQPDPAIYQPYAQVTRPFFLDHMTFAVRTAAKPSIVAPSLRRAVHDVDKDLPVQSLTAMNDVLTAATAEPLFQARLLATFSLLALALSAVGIYGVVACSVTERTHEIGIRIALGAEPGAVLRMVLRRTLTLAGAGLVLGAIGAVAATRVMARLLFEVRPGDPATILAVVMLLTTVALCAGLIPGRRAARVDPIRALRAE